jgi:hypothetical protein
MVCIPGGPAVVGSAEHEARERPPHTVEIATFYLDRYEVTNAAYEACERARACPPRVLPDKAFLAPEQPAVPITWHGAHAYCLWAGKRLPSEAEWEKAARGGLEARLYPWGDAPASCERAQTAGCGPGTTLRVGSLPAGAYGLFDMAGNGYEWVQDWASACYDGCASACGSACTRADPHGPCGGGPLCAGRKMRVLKGGSWRWDAGEARGAWRRFELADSGAHRLSVRCASSWPLLSSWPPLALAEPPPEPPDPRPPASEALAAFRDVPDDEDVLKIPPCEKAGEATHHCRDPLSYLVTNEDEQHLWEPFVRNLGGGYVGIGADQSYSLAATAQSEWVWIFDYDPQVVLVHHVLHALVREAEGPAAFVALFEEANAPRARALIAAAPLAAADREAALRLYAASRPHLLGHYAKRLEGGVASFDWLASRERYAHVRALVEQGRVLARKGNLLTDVALPAIARAARRLGVPIRLYYTSNAEDLWPLTERYRRNVLALPFDERSLALRTVYPKMRQRGGTLPWEYHVHAVRDLRRTFLIPEWDRVWFYSTEGRRLEPPRLIAIGLPGTTPR